LISASMAINFAVASSLASILTSSSATVGTGYPPFDFDFDARALTSASCAAKATSNHHTGLVARSHGGTPRYRAALMTRYQEGTDPNTPSVLRARARPFTLGGPASRRC
jgi:hypothetical protein